MHPYEMQRLLKQRGKDKVVNVGQRASMYQMINRLERDGLIAVAITVRDNQRPERTVYEITDAGRDAFFDWLRGMLSEPKPEFPEFPAALSYLMLLGVEDVIEQLEKRRDGLAASLRVIVEELEEWSPKLPRMALLDDELRRAVHEAELAWLTGVIDDLRAGRLTWSKELVAELSVWSREME